MYNVHEMQIWACRYKSRAVHKYQVHRKISSTFQPMKEEIIDRIRVWARRQRHSTIRKEKRASSQAGEELAEKFFNNSTFNGALYIFASKSWTKCIIWLLVIVTTIGGFWAVTIADIIRLVREPIATLITLTRENELSFPAVTICSLSILNITTLNSGGQTVVSNLSALIDISDRDPTECKNIANQLARNTGVNVGWGGLTNTAKMYYFLTVRTKEKSVKLKISCQ